jgi:16S rRNA (guanine1207-N2)-methyltransferase
MDSELDRYYKTTTFQASLAGQPVSFCSKPGLPDWQEITPGEILLAEHAGTERSGGISGSRLLLMGCRHGALAAALAGRLSPAGLWITDNSALALELCACTLEAGKTGRAKNFSPAKLSSPAMIFSPLSPPGYDPGSLDAALIQLPKGRGLARRWLVQAHGALRPGGLLFLAGPNDEGIQPAIKDAAGLFGRGAVLAYKKGSRVARFEKPGGPDLETGSLSPPAWAGEPGIAPGAWIEFTADSSPGLIRLRSLPGIFSYDRLDPGTGLLLEKLGPELSRQRVLDLGCGYGVLGLAAARLGAARVDLVDDNLLAVLAARENIRLHGLANARALPGDGITPVADQLYDLVLSNPPFHTGKGVDYQVSRAFILGARRVLAPGGRLVLVANRFIRYDQLMRTLFSQVAVLAETGKFHVLSGTDPLPE